MPVRPLARARVWLLPPSLDELVGADHPARFVGAFVESLDELGWHELGVQPDGNPRGAPAYHPRALLGVWLYGFMTGVRSSRKLETACRDQLPYLWLTGWQHPDHNTLWRFYQTHRTELRRLLKRTVRVAVRAGLVDLAIQAVDGSKIAGSAARDRSLDAAGLQALLQRTETAIADLEAQNQAGEDAPAPRLPAAWTKAKVLQEQVGKALAQVQAEDGPSRVNLTDPDARIMKNARGYQVGYNGQAMVSSVVAAPGEQGGLFITAADLTNAPDDHGQLLPLLDQALENVGRAAAMTAADTGYHSGPNLVGCAQRGQPIVMPEARHKARRQPYAKEAFVYDAVTDRFRCPEGQWLAFIGRKRRHHKPVARVYRAAAGTCAGCPAFQTCAKGSPRGRTVTTGPEEEQLRQHQVWMATPLAKEAYRRRKVLPEPVFGILKEAQGARRFLLRGLAKVAAEWSLLATAFNLRTLHRIWARWQEPLGTGRWLSPGAAA